MINRVTLVGNLGKDPVVQFTGNGQPVANLRIATSRSWTDKKSGQRKEETEWHDVEVWGKQAEQCGEFLNKGRLVYIEGRLKTDKWQDKQSHQDRYRTKVVADIVRFLGGGRVDHKNGAENAEEPSPGTGGELESGGGAENDIAF